MCKDSLKSIYRHVSRLSSRRNGSIRVGEGGMSGFKTVDYAQEPRQNTAGFHILILSIKAFNKRESIRRRLKAMAGQVKKRSIHGSM